MIKSVSAFSPLDSFRGQASDSSISKDTKKKLALVYSTGAATTVGVVTASILRGYLSSWSKSGFVGSLVGLGTLCFLAPRCLRDEGLISANATKDTFVKQQNTKNISKFDAFVEKTANSYKNLFTKRA